MLQALPDSMQLLHTQEGIDPYTPGPEIPGLILTGSIVQVVIWVADGARLGRAHARPTALLLAPHRGRRLAAIALVVFTAIALSGDPALIEQLTTTAG